MAQICQASAALEPQWHWHDRIWLKDSENCLAVAERHDVVTSQGQMHSMRSFACGPAMKCASGLSQRSPDMSKTRIQRWSSTAGSHTLHPTIMASCAFESCGMTCAELESCVTTIRQVFPTVDARLMPRQAVPLSFPFIAHTPERAVHFAPLVLLAGAHVLVRRAG